MTEAEEPEAGRQPGPWPADGAWWSGDGEDPAATAALPDGPRSGPPSRPAGPVHGEPAADDASPTRRTGPTEIELADAWLRELGLNDSRLTGPPPLPLKEAGIRGTSRAAATPTYQPRTYQPPTHEPPGHQPPTYEATDQPEPTRPTSQPEPTRSTSQPEPTRSTSQPEPTQPTYQPTYRPAPAQPEPATAAGPPPTVDPAPEPDEAVEDDGPRDTGPFALPPKVPSPVPQHRPPTSEPVSAPAHLVPPAAVRTPLPHQPTSAPIDLPPTQPPHTQSPHTQPPHTQPPHTQLPQAHPPHELATDVGPSDLQHSHLQDGEAGQPGPGTATTAVAGRKETAAVLLPLTVPAQRTYPPAPGPPAKMRGARSPRRPSVSLPALVVLALAIAFFGWVSAEPFWLAVGHGHKGTATLVSTPGGCRAAFTADDRSFTVASVDVAGREECRDEAALPASMVSASSPHVYVTDLTGLNGRWGVGFGLVLLCGLAIAAVTGGGRVPGWRGRAVAALSLAAPVLVAATMVALAY